MLVFREHEGNLDPQPFQDWMRVIFNLSVNTSYDRPEDLQRSMVGLKTLLPESGSVLKYFATSETHTAGFSLQQISEEKLKAELILGHSGWRPLIERAEGHGYFRGQVEARFLWRARAGHGERQGRPRRRLTSFTTRAVR
jgi:hypothetical protein